MGWRTLLVLALTLGAVGALVAAAWRSGASGVAGAGRLRDLDQPRVVALSPGVAATLRDLGGAGMMVGRHGYDAWSDRALPVVGDQAGINAEAMLRVAPTHVYVEFGGAERARGLLGPVRGAAGVAVVRDFRLLSLDQVRESVVTLAGDLPIPPERAAALLGAWDRALEPVPTGEARGLGTVLLLHGTDPPAALGPGSFHQQIAERLGLEPALKAGDAYTVLDSEGVLRLQPGTIVLIQPRQAGVAAEAGAGWAWLRGAAARERLGPLGTLRVPAVERERVLLIDLDDALLPGTGLIRLAEGLRAAVGERAGAGEVR